MPHTHLRGTRWQYTLEKPDSTSEVILDVPHYDFNWQTYYMFDKPLELPAGAKITSMAWYDNSATNKHNPEPEGRAVGRSDVGGDAVHGVPVQRPEPATPTGQRSAVVVVEQGNAARIPPAPCRVLFAQM